MNESIRTLVYVGVGVVATLAAYAARPVLNDVRAIGGGKEWVGKPLFPNFKDPLEAKILEIQQFDETTARAKSFTVAQDSKGGWVIPSHGNYPADAANQMRAVAETLADLKVLDVASEVNTDHALLGVLDPTKAEVGTAGVGTLLTMQDAKGNDLLKLIVGKADGTRPELRFVRKPAEDVVFVATIDLTKLPTEFDKWIEKDLLKISTFDVARVTLKDYLILPTQQGRMVYYPRMDAVLTYDSSKGEWKLEKMLSYRGQGQGQGQEPREVELDDLEELNKTKLDELRSALGDLKIVNVRRKPTGLGNSLRVSKDKLTDDQRAELQAFGFYAQPAADGTLDIYGANGEVIVDTKDGVEYVLRFGDIAPDTDISSTSSTTPKDGAKKEEEQVKVNRYLFVTTQVAQAILTPPALEPEPAGPPEGDKKEGEAAKAGEPKAGEPKSDEEQPAVIDPKQAERERIKRENERKLNEYRDKKKKADTRMGELNARFADWYYVVSEDVYKKIRLVRTDIVKEAATAKEEGFGIDAFRKLEEEGLKAPTKPATPTP